MHHGVAHAEDVDKGFAIPEEIAADLVLDGSKTQVVIYYANESRPNENLNRLADWFAGADSDRVRKVGERLRQDAKDFPDVVASEVEALRAAAGSKTKPFAVAVFTNALAREGQFEYLPADDRDGKFQTGALPLPAFASHPEGIAAAARRGWPARLVAAAGQFPPAKHIYLLINKSHGNKAEVVASLLARTYGPKDRDRVVKEMTLSLKRRDQLRKGLGRRPRRAPGLDGDKMDNPILDGDKMDSPILDGDKMENPDPGGPGDRVDRRALWRWRH